MHRLVSTLSVGTDLCMYVCEGYQFVVVRRYSQTAHNTCIEWEKEFSKISYEDINDGHIEAGQIHLVGDINTTYQPM